MEKGWGKMFCKSLSFSRGFYRWYFFSVVSQGQCSGAMVTLFSGSVFTCQNINRCTSSYTSWGLLRKPTGMYTIARLLYICFPKVGLPQHRCSPFVPSRLKHYKLFRLFLRMFLWAFLVEGLTEGFSSTTEKLSWSKLLHRIGLGTSCDNPIHAILPDFPTKKWVFNIKGFPQAWNSGLPDYHKENTGIAC